MTYPSVFDDSTHNEISSGVIGIDVPADVELDDLAVAQIIIDRSGENLTVNWTSGWVRLDWLNSGAAGAIPGVMYVARWMNGDEGGTTVNETKNGGTPSLTACTVIRGADRQVAFDLANATSTSTNPDPPSLTAWQGAEDNLWLASVAGDGDGGAITGGDSDYTAGVNTAGSGYSVATKSRQYNASDTQDPSAWTRNSDQWITHTAAFRPKRTRNYPRVLRADHLHASDALQHDYTITIPDGRNRAMFVWVNANITTLVLDPAGINQALSYCTDGTDTAKQPTDAEATVGSWSTLDPSLIPAPGTYTLRVNPAGTLGGAQIFVVVLEDAAQELAVRDVSSFITASSLSNHDSDLIVPDGGGIFLLAATRQFAGSFVANGVYVYVSSDPTTCCNSDGVRMMAQREIHNNISRHSSLFIKGYGPDRGGDTITNRVRASSASTGNVLGIAVGYAPPTTRRNPHYFGGC
jgi:hypothetical protein